MEPAERQLKAGVDGQFALEAEQKRACGGATSEGDQPEERGMVPGAQQLTEAASDPCGADWSGICRSAAPPEPAEAVRNRGRFRVRERSVPLSPVRPKGLRRASAGGKGAEVEAASRWRTAAGSAKVRNEPEMNPRRGGAEGR